MAKISIEQNVNGITMEANYFNPGIIAAFVGGLMLAPTIAGIEIRIGIHDIGGLPGLILLFLPYVLPVVGTILLIVGIMAIGTSQVITYDRTKQTITYDSTIALFWGDSHSHSTEGLTTINYNLHKVKHTEDRNMNHRVGMGMHSGNVFRPGVSHTTWESVIQLWYTGKDNVDLAKISHSESLEQGLKMVAKEIGCDYERHVNEEERTGLM